MRFGLIPVTAAVGAVLAHSVAGLRKGRVLAAEDVARLQAAGITEVMAARLSAGDVPENAAAARLAARLAGAGVAAAPAATGRANLHATQTGLLVMDQGALMALNAIDEGLTLATLPPFRRVQAGGLVGTVKILPYAMGGAGVARGEAAARPIAVAPFVRQRVGLVITRTERGKASLADKAEAATAARVEALGGRGATVRRVAHAISAIAAALSEMADHDVVLVAGEAAIADRGDVVPQGIVAAGGRLSHFGLPVDPGNLLLLAELRGVPVIGVPSCARSLKRNGFDLVLERVMAGLTPGPLDLGAMGVGGLLSEIASRPSPRDAGGLRRQGHVAGLVLAAGQSRRMGRTKLLEPVAGAPLVRRVAEKLVGLGLAEVIVVTGHDAEGVAAALAGLPLRLVHNENYAQGLARSLRTGIAALGPEVTAALVCLGDMPRVAVEDMAALVQAGAGGRVAVPVRGGRRGNPVLWPAAHFAALMALTGDQGARGLLTTLQDVVEVAASDDGIFTDIDTPDDLRSVRESGS